MLMFLVFIVVAGASILTIVSVGNVITNNQVSIPSGIPELTVTPKFVHTCFGNEQKGPYVVAQEKFTSENLNNCMPFEEGEYAYLIELYQDDVKKAQIQSHNWVGATSTREITEDVFIDSTKIVGKLKLKIKNV